MTPKSKATHSTSSCACCAERWKRKDASALFARCAASATRWEAKQLEDFDSLAPDSLVRARDGGGVLDPVLYDMVRASGALDHRCECTPGTAIGRHAARASQS